MHKSNPKVSVCIPVYNCEAYLANTIRSVLAQTLTDFELVIIDNASTDHTAEVIRSFDDLRIRNLRNDQNLGMMGNWNRCLAEAKGDFIKLLPADDLIYPTCLERQVSACTLHPSVSLVCCSRDIIDVHGKKLIKRSFTGLNGLVRGVEAVKRIVRSGTNRLGEPGAILFRRDLLGQERRFSDRYPYVIDLGLWIQLLGLGDLFVIQESLCAFRVSPQSESVNSRHFHRDDFSKFIRSMDRQTFELTSFDIACGVVNSSLLEFMRRVFYKLTRVLDLIKK